MWFVRLITVGASVTASYAIRSAPSASSVYVTESSRRPGNPSSPSGLTRDSRTPCSTGSASHTRLSKPWTPPCRQLGALFCASRYVRPSSAKAPPAMRFAYRPTSAPKYGSECAR